MAEPTPAVAAATPAPITQRLREVLFATPADIVTNVSLLIALLVVVWQLPFIAHGDTEEFTEDLFQHGYVLIWMLVATALGRTLRLRLLAAFFLLGLFPAVLLMQWLGPVLIRVFGDDRMFDSFAVPLLEEVVKAVPIAILFWFLVRRGWQPSMTDGLLLGFLIGAGMAIHENALYQRLYGAGLNDSALGLIFPTLGSESTLSRVEVYGFYHSGWGSLTGLAIGAGFFVRRRFRLAFLIPILALAIVVLDHGIGNYIIEEQGVEGLGILWTLNLDGRLPIYLLLVSIPLAIVAEILILRERGRADRIFPGFSAGEALRWLTRGLPGLLRVQAARNYVRARRALHYLVWAERNEPEPPRLLRQARLAEISAAAAGVPVVTPSASGEPAR